MQCTPQEIEEKRRQAQMKLAAKYKQNLSPLKNLNKQPTTSSYSSNLKEKLPLQVNNASKTAWCTPGTSRTHGTKPYEKTKSPSSFYPKNNVITGKTYLISEERFVVELSSFSAQAVEIFKTMSTRFYNTSTRNWDFSIKEYEVLMERLKHLKPHVVVGKIPSYVLNCVRMPKPDYSCIDLTKIETELLSALMPFQVEGVCFAIDKNGRCLIADDMGLGKTFQALAVASYYKEDWPLLILTTASMKNVWEEKIQTYLPSVLLMHIQYMTSTKDYIGDSKILICSHDLISRCPEKLADKNFGVIIIDESHTFKNFKAKCTKVASDLAKHAKRIILLSGTPALSRPSELYTQLSLINEKFFGNFYNYSARYCDGKNTNFGWDASGKSNLQELEVLLLKNFMIRRTKEEVLKNLPNKKQEVITLDVNLSQINSDDRRVLNSLAQKYNSERKSSNKHAILLTFFNETAKIKIPSVCSYILQVLEETSKFLVFSHHQIMLNAIEQVLIKKKKGYIRIDGGTSAGKRKKLVDTFQNDDDCCCAILSITAANAGITLTAAQLVIFAELHWNPSILSQAEARAHRIGQEGTVNVRYLLAPGTADDSIWPMLQNKQKILNEVGLSKDSYQEVSVSFQKLQKDEKIASCLDTGVTSVNTLDISTYFKSPEIKKNVISKNAIEHERNGSENDEDIKNEMNEDKVNRNAVKNLDFFNDDLDDMLMSVDI